MYKCNTTLLLTYEKVKNTKIAYKTNLIYLIFDVTMCYVQVMLSAKSNNYIHEYC